MVVHPDSIRITRGRTYSGTSYYFECILYTGLSPSMVLLSKRFYYTNKRDIGVLQPPTEVRFGLFPLRSSLLRESLLISFIRLLRYFSSPTYLHTLNGLGVWYPDKSGWVSPLGNPRIIVWLLTPRGLSQASTSFIGNISQGIRYIPINNFLLQKLDLFIFRWANCRKHINYV